MNEAAEQRPTRRRAPHPQTPVLEWILGGAGLALLIAGLAFLIAEAVKGPGQPGAVTVTSTDVTALPDSYLVQFTARNDGGVALAELHIGARVLDGSTVLESAEAVIDHLPGGSQRTGGFYLRHDPRRYRLQLDALSYQTP